MWCFCIESLLHVVPFLQAPSFSLLWSVCILSPWICTFEDWLQESAVKDSVFVFGGNSLGVQAFAPSSLVLIPSTPFVLFIFHAFAFTPLLLHYPHSYCLPLPISLSTPPRPPPPPPPPPAAWPSANLELSAVRGDIPEAK